VYAARVERYQITAAIVDAIVAHARREAPHECCGLLVGQGNAIERMVPTRNAAATPATRYLVDPEQHFAVIRELRGTAHDIVGAYHSHVSSPAAPSQTDIAQAWTAQFLYVIVSLLDEARPDVRAFSIDGGNFVSVELITDRP
jgi:[CysO sulfur-carrier protein]-S-L-cysteine hydrolase